MRRRQRVSLSLPALTTIDRRGRERVLAFKRRRNGTQKYRKEDMDRARGVTICRCMDLMRRGRRVERRAMERMKSYKIASKSLVSCVTVTMTGRKSAKR